MSKRLKIDWDGLETRRKWDRTPRPCQGAKDQDRPWWPVVGIAALLTSIGFAVLHATMGL